MPDPAAPSAFLSACRRKCTRRAGRYVVAVLLLFMYREAHAQTGSSQPADACPQEAYELRELRDAVRQLQDQVTELKQQLNNHLGTDSKLPATPAATPLTATPHTESAVAQQDIPAQAKPEDTAAALDFLGQTTIEVGVDTYYGFNFNDPIGRVNLLRAYDVSSNAFSLNQANIILKQEPDLSKGRRFGARLDLQFGQATETLQGNPLNEPRPDVYRNVFQAFGTYVLPFGNGLKLDVGKFASSLGYENNYSKDQMNYSRSYWFIFLPFYHMGARFSYKLNDLFALNYWIVNGTQQTEPFNGFKDQFFGLVVTPTKSITWNVNYYLGQEHPDVAFFPNGGAPPNSPSLQGVPFQPIPNAANGLLHIFDTYISWQATPKLTFVAEGDYVVERLLKESAPSHVSGGAGYVEYQFTPKIDLAARGEYLSDRGGLFSGKTEALKEITLTYGYKLVGGFLVQTEFRRDFSNQPVFLTDTLGVLSKHQNTATIGLIWWWGNKKSETSW